MKKIFGSNILKCYIEKHNLESILDKEILSHAQLHFYEKDECIFQAESQLQYYYLLVDGKIKVSYPFENGKSMILKFYKDFNTIGDLELLKNIPIRCNIDAISDTYLIGIPSNILRREFFHNMKLLHHLIDSLSEKLYATINNSSYNFVYPLINRLSSYLFEHMTEETYIILNSSFLDIAQFLGTTYRHLNRTIKEMEAKAIIKCENKTIYILDKAKLQELAKNLFVSYAD